MSRERICEKDFKVDGEDRKGLSFFELCEGIDIEDIINIEDEEDDNNIEVFNSHENEYFEENYEIFDFEEDPGFRILEKFENLILHKWRAQFQLRLDRFNFVLNNKFHASNKGKQVIFKLINNKDYPVDQLEKETKFYNDQGIYVFWVLNADNFHHYSESGLKHNLHITELGLSRNLQIMELEKFIQKMILGRVYYVNLDQRILFACYFSLPDDRKHHGLKRKGFWKRRYFFIRNANLYIVEGKRRNLLIPDEDYYFHSICRLYDKKLDDKLSMEIQKYLE